MKIKNILTVTAISLLGIVSLPVFAQQDHSNMNMANMEDPKAVEPHFLQMMTDHHQQGVEMAKMAKQKASTKEVKSMSEQIIKDQTKEIAQLQSWKNKWYKDVDAKMDMPKMDMTSLENAKGKEFDTAFLEMMSKHHQDAISMTEKVSDKLQHKEVKNFASKTIEKQKSEIAKLDQMKKSMQ